MLRCFDDDQVEAYQQVPVAGVAHRRHQLLQPNEQLAGQAICQYITARSPGLCVSRQKRPPTRSPMSGLQDCRSLTIPHMSAVRATKLSVICVHRQS